MKKVKLSLIMVIMLLVVAMGSSVFATDTIPNATGNTTVITTPNTTPNPNPTTNTANTSNTTKTNSTYNNNLPATGAGQDFSIMLLIVVGGVSALYAYKKIRDYNV